MTSLSKLQARGLVELVNVYSVDVDVNGKVCNLVHTKGWQGKQGDFRVSLYFRQVECRAVQVHYGAWIVCREDLPKVQAAVDVVLREDWCIYWNPGRNLWDSQPDCGQNTSGWQKTTRLGGLKFEAECQNDDSLTRGTY